MHLVSVKDKEDRKAIIETEAGLSNKVEGAFYRGKVEECKVIRIPIDVPIYRMKNGRTQVEQFFYIQDNNKAKNFFNHGEENKSVQLIQHEILLTLSQDHKGNIYNELAHVSSQRERLLITVDGVVVNGNRRLAAMRDLYIKDPQGYSEFSHVDVIVLPPEATEKDIEMIETELQLKPETKLEYGWIARRLKLRLQLETLQIPRDDIKKIYRFKREDDINVELQQLSLAEEYLQEYLGKPNAYKEVEKSEQLFKDLQKALSGKSGDEEEIRRTVGFLLAKEARNLGDRVYDFRQVFGNKFEDVLDKYAEDQGIILTEHPEVDLFTDFDDDEIDDDDILEGLDVQKPSKYAPLKRVLKDQDKSKDTAEKLIKILESVKQREKEDSLRQIGIKNSQEALRLLNEIDLTNCAPSTHDQIIGQLKGIVEVSNNLISNLTVTNQG